MTNIDKVNKVILNSNNIYDDIIATGNENADYDDDCYVDEDEFDELDD